MIERAAGSVQVLDTSARSAIARVEGLGDLSHASAVYSRDGRYAFVFGRDGGLTKVDLLAARIDARILQAGNSIGGAISQDGRVVAALNSSSHSRRVTKARIVRERLAMLRNASRAISAATRRTESASSGVSTSPRAETRSVTSKQSPGETGGGGGVKRATTVAPSIGEGAPSGGPPLASTTFTTGMSERSGGGRTGSRRFSRWRRCRRG